MTLHGTSTLVVGAASTLSDRWGRMGALVRRGAFSLLILAIGAYAGLPWLAPVFMRLGQPQAGRLLYAVYSTQCHQLAQRSLFLFGPQPMYSTEELGRLAGVAGDPLALRAFVGSAEVGWKLAWSDRMTAMYTSLFAFSLLGWRLRHRLRPLPVGAFIALLLPMALDGGSHFISDLSGFGLGFRDQNAWLSALTGGIFPPSFYAGDALGSFNSSLRWLTGVLFGLGVAWAVLPRLGPLLGSGAYRE